MPSRTRSSIAYRALRGTLSTIALTALAGTVAWTSGSSAPVAPTNTAPPAITGTPRVGQTLTAFDGTWSGNPTPTLARRWQYSVDGSTGWTTISGATSTTYTPTSAREGQFIRVQVQATNSAGTSAWVSSAATAAVAAANSATGLLSGTTWPSQSQAQPTDLIPANARLFATSTPYIAAVPSGVTFGSTGAVFDGTTTAATVFDITLPTALVTGRRYGLLFGMPERTAGNVSVALMPGNVSPEGASMTAARNFTRAFVATQAHTSVRITIGAGANLRMNYISLVDMTSLLAKKWRVVFIFDAQSNIVGAESSDVDWSIERPELRAVYIPGVANSPFGSTFDANGVGKPLIVQDPLQHSTTNAGGGPMGSFVKRMTDSLRDDEILVLIATGWAGQGRLNSGYWNRDGSDFRAWTNMLTQLRGTLAQAPTGSTVCGALQCGHEADVSVNSATLLPAAVSRDIADLRAEFGQFPVVMMEIGTQNVSANQVAQQDAMEALAGSLSLCRYVRRPAGATFRPDGIHYDQPTNRIRGAAAAEAMLEMSYGSTRPSTGTAPSFTTAASISPASGAVGTVFTISNGTATGSPSPTITRTLTQAGVDVTSQISSGQFTSTAAGALVLTVTATNGVSPAATSTANATVTASSGAIAGTLTNPPLSARLGVLDRETARPFNNHFKMAWAWNGDGSSSGMNWNALRTAGHITQNGVVNSVPAGGIITRALFQFAAESGATGRWRLKWSGSGTISLQGVANEDWGTPGQVSFDYTANGQNYISIIVSAVTSQLSNFSLVHADDIAHFDAGNIFRAAYLAEVRNYRCLRFDEWIGILRSEEEGGLKITTWASRPVPADEMFHRWIPYEYMAALCNQVGADMWVCMPTAATDDHFTGAATLMQSLMPAPRRVYVEYTTKTWDFSGTPQAHYCAEQGRIAFGTTGAPTDQEFLSWYGMRSTQCAQAWRAVWGSSARLRTVIQSQADWLGNEAGVLTAPMWQERSGTMGLPTYVAPHSVIDVLTVHAQIDGGMAYGGRVTELENWRTTLTQTVAFNRIRDQMLHGTYWTADRTVDGMVSKWEYFRDVADGYGMELASYEVGNHLNGVGGSTALQSFIHDFSVSSQMGEVYSATVGAIRTAGFDGPLVMSVECRWPDSNSCHGLQRWLGDHNAAWAAVDAIQQVNDGPTRGASDFIGTMEVA